MSEEKKNDFLIVTELPNVPVNKIQGDDGKEYDLVTLTDAIKEILQAVREIKKSVA